MKRAVLDLRPTQFAVGMLEVDEKIAVVSRMGARKLGKFIAATPVPVVKSPHGHLYVVDHHHFLCVCYHVGVKKVRVKVVKDLSRSNLGYAAFWKWMLKTRNAYPFCQFGEGPRNALYLPRDIRGLADDPYRSLAWFVRKSGAFDPSEKNFAEFKWANFFRQKRLLDRFGPEGMVHALEKAVKLAQSSGARHLPGYGKLNLEKTSEALTKAKKKGKELFKELSR